MTTPLPTFEFAILRHAARLMSPSDLDTARKLAAAADAGDDDAYNELKRFVYSRVNLRKVCKA